MWIIVISKVTTLSWLYRLVLMSLFIEQDYVRTKQYRFLLQVWLDMGWKKIYFIFLFRTDIHGWTRLIILVFLITIVRRNTYTNQNVGCVYFRGTDDGLNLYYVPQALMYCQFGQMLQQGVNNFCVNNSNIAQNASYSLCVSRDVSQWLYIGQCSMLQP